MSVLLVFLPFYLYQLGYSFAAIFAFYGFFFAARALADILAAYFVASYGPKHSIALSCLLQIVSASMLLSLATYGWPLWVIAVVFGTSASFFFIAYHVEFSKIKHAEHAGKELGEMQIFEKIAAIAGPLVGGFAGSYLGPHYIFVVACGILLASLLPLFRTSEPVQTGQALHFSQLPVHRLRRDFAAYSALGVENTLCNIWPLYVALFALTGSVYAQLGILASASVAVSIGSAYAIGRFIDHRSARKMLRIAAIANMGVYGLRPLASSLLPAFAIGVANEAITTAYRMPFVKGMYAAADDLPGLRIVYIASMECVSSIAKSTAWWLLVICALSFTGRPVLLVAFGLAALASLAIMLERFKALK